MRPDLFTIPLLGIPIKSYGFMMMVGFLSAVWIGMRRAERVKASPDMILNCGMVSLLFGIAGARLFYVVHYWKSNFAYMKNPLLAAFDITAGGLEYLGGVIGAVLGIAGYSVLYGRLFARGAQRPSLRLYLDMLAPLSIWGLAMTRVGCFLNGCCWGGVCANHEGEKALPWAMAFPFNSPAHERQWMNRQVSMPAELIVDDPRAVAGTPMLIPRSLLESTPEEVWGPIRAVEAFEEQYASAKAKGAPAEELKRMDQERVRLEKAAEESKKKLDLLIRAMQFPSREDPTRPTTATELRDLAHGLKSLPVHPTQLYDAINAALFSWLLWTIHGHRRRHGVVFGWMLILYPFSRIPLELIRVDNPHDVGGLTISQAFSIGVFVVGLIWMWAMYRLPVRSPLAVPYIDPYAKPDAAAGPASAPAPA